MRRARSSRWLLQLSLAALVLGLGSCSPADLSALTLDTASRRPVIVLGLCRGESVAAVSLRPVKPDDYAGYTTGASIWEIHANRAQPLSRVVAGVVPGGYRQTVRLDERRLAGELEFRARITGGNAVSHGSTFRMSELKPDRLVQYGRPISKNEFRRETEIVCSGNPFDDFGIPLWILWSFLAAVTVAYITGVAFAVRSQLRLRNLRRLEIVK